jgi:hypothetical protein
MEKAIKKNRKSNILYFVYFFAFYTVVFTNNFYIFSILLAAIIIKFSIAIKNSIIIINQWRLQKLDFQKLNYNNRQMSVQLLFFTYLFIFLSIALIISIIIYRFDFWSKYIFK